MTRILNLVSFVSLVVFVLLAFRLRPGRDRRPEAADRWPDLYSL
jgi:hypothetical protein